jgi:hypothetical protein
MKTFVLGILLLVFNVSIGFSEDSVRLFPKIDSTIWQKTLPSIGIKIHRSFYKGQMVPVYGLRFAVLLKKKYRLGIAYYESGYVRLEDVAIGSDLFLQKAKCKNTHLFFEYLWMNTTKWVGDVGIGAGLAKGTFFYKRSDNLLDSIHKTPYLGVLNLSASVEYKIRPYIGISGGFGYTLIGHSNANTEQALISEIFTTPFFKLNLALHCSELYTHFFK